MTILTILLQATGPGASGMSTLFFMGMIFLVFYFFMIRPQVKKQKTQAAFENAIMKGDEIVTTSGILGKINKIEENIITLEVGTKTYIRITKNAISKEMTEAIFATTDDKEK